MIGLFGHVNSGMSGKTSLVDFSGGLRMILVLVNMGQPIPHAEWLLLTNHHPYPLLLVLLWAVRSNPALQKLEAKVSPSY